MQWSDLNGDKGWRASKQKQLDEMAMDQMFGEPVLPPKGTNILQTIWSYVQKPDKKKARNCCNGKQLKHQKMKMHNSPLSYFQSYAACASQF